MGHAVGPPAAAARLEDDGTTMFTGIRVNRVFLFAGLFYGILGMKVGGTRTLRIAPHLAFGAEGRPGVIPANALLTAELSVPESAPPRTCRSKRSQSPHGAAVSPVGVSR
jgi:hypothetical protein